MSLKQISSVVLASAVSAVVAVVAYQKIFEPKSTVQIVENVPVKYTSLTRDAVGTLQPVDFRYAAANATPSVVHIKSAFKVEPVRYSDPMQDLFGNDIFRFFHGPNPYQQNQPKVASGSGVIVSEDGYIVTNNHVVENANEIDVTLHNNKTYKAKLIGKDADTDLALIKIEGEQLPAINFANSDSVMIGEWVMAVGNPFNLSSTVTAGIVSAKARSINILGRERNAGNSAIEAFIQTDAAVNPGNSGGALVNIGGELIGINTAIASPTGSYAGYSFAVPANLVRKVVMDLQKYGVTQRGYLGVQIRSVDDEIAKQAGLDRPAGVYVDQVNEGSASKEAGLQSKDIITKINGVSVNSAPELQEQVARYRPGDKLNVEVIRNGKMESKQVVLKNKYNTTAAVDSNRDILGALGLEVADLSPKEKAQLGVESGVKVTNIKQGKISQFTDIKQGFVITQIDDQPVNSVDDFVSALKAKNGKVLVEGIYPNRPMSYLYAFKM